MSRYTIAQGPTKWTTALEKIYAKQSEQLNRHHEQLRERDRQMVEKAKNESLANTFGALAQFSSTVGAAVQAGKKRHETWKEKYNLGLSTRKESLQHSETIDKIRKLRYKEEKEKVSHQPEIDKLVTLLRKDGKNSTAFDLLNVSGRRLVAQNELLAQNAAAGHTVASMRKFYSDKGLEDKVNEIDTNNNNPDYIRGMLYEYQHDRLAHLNLNDDAIAGILGGELKRQRDTAGGTAKAKANAAVSDKDDLRILTQIETANRVGTLEESIWSVRESLVNEGKFQEYVGADGKTVTVNQQVDAYLFETLNDLSQDGLINTSQLQPYIDSGFRHPAGKGGESTPGEILFTKEQVNRLIKSAQFGESRYVSIQTQLDTNSLQQIKTRRAQGIINAEDNDLLDKISHRGLVSDESIEGVREVKPQDSNFFVNESKYFETTKTTGTFLTESNISRAKLNDSNIANEQEAIIASQESQQFPKFEDRKRSHDQTIADDSDDGTFDVKTDSYGANTWKGQLSTEMAQAEDLIYMKYFNLNPNDPDIKTKVLIDMDALKLKNGFGIKIGEKGAGIWSKDKYGNYPNFVRAKTGIVTIRANESNYEKNLITNWNNLDDVPGETKVDTFLNTPGTVLPPKEVIDIITSENPQFSPKFIYKVGRLPGKPKGKALVQMAQALIDSDDPEIQQLVKRSGLESKLKELTTPDGKNPSPLQKLIQTEEFLIEVVSKTADPDINNLQKRIEKVGWENLSPKEQIRYYNGINMIEDLNTEPK